MASGAPIAEWVETHADALIGFVQEARPRRRARLFRRRPSGRGGPGARYRSGGVVRVRGRNSLGRTRPTARPRRLCGHLHRALGSTLCDCATGWQRRTALAPPQQSCRCSPRWRRLSLESAAVLWELVDGLIHGRGSVDAKGPLAALLFGVACAKAIAGETLGDLTLVSVADEESGGMCTLDSLVHGDCADAVMIGEPTEVGIAPAARGATGFRLTVHGRQAHSGAAFEGVNAIAKAAACMTAIDELQASLDRDRPNDLYRELPVAHAFNIGSIQGGGFLGVVPDTCIVGGVAPAIGDETIADARTSLTTAIDQVTAKDPWLTEHPPLLEWVPPSFEPSYTPGDHEFVRVAQAAVARELGAPPVIGPLLGGSDLRFYSRHFGIPGIHIGPGALKLGHGANETLAVAELVAATRAVAAITLDWTGGES